MSRATPEDPNDRDAELQALGQVQDATPGLLEQRLLQHRIDRKFVMPRRQLPALVAALAEGHRLLRANGAPAASYSTCYFDTADRQMYEEHRLGRLPRFKVRVRHQLERELTFLEVKRKTQDGRTLKARLARPFRDTRIDADAATFIGDHSPFSADALLPQLWIEFRRATLLSAQNEERLTIDWDFEFRSSDRIEQWPHVAIVEIKQPRFESSSPAIEVLRQMGIRETGVSKYCVGTVLLAPVRDDTFKPALRLIEQLSA